MPPLIKYSHSPAVPWANGQGRTSELVSWERSRILSTAPGPTQNDARAADRTARIPDWRLSIARLDGPAPFSAIPGVRRNFMPVGVAVTLVVNGVARPVADRTVAAFAGDDDVDLVDLTHRPGHAVNLMVRAGSNDSASPRLILADTGDARFSTCLVAVALEALADIDAFDVLNPGDGPGRAERPIAVAVVYSASPVTRSGRT